MLAGRQRWRLRQNKMRPTEDFLPLVLDPLEASPPPLLFALKHGDTFLVTFYAKCTGTAVTTTVNHGKGNDAESFDLSTIILNGSGSGSPSK